MAFLFILCVSREKKIWFLLLLFSNLLWFYFFSLAMVSTEICRLTATGVSAWEPMSKVRMCASNESLVNSRRDKHSMTNQSNWNSISSQWASYTHSVGRSVGRYAQKYLNLVEHILIACILLIISRITHNNNKQSRENNQDGNIFFVDRFTFSRIFVAFHTSGHLSAYARVPSYVRKMNETKKKSTQKLKWKTRARE